MSRRLSSCSGPSGARGQPSPLRFVVSSEDESQGEYLTPGVKPLDASAIPDCLRPGWRSSSASDFSCPLSPTIPALPPPQSTRTAPLAAPPTLLTNRSAKKSQSGPPPIPERPPFDPEIAGTYEEFPTRPTAQELEALLFMVNVQHHDFATIKLRLNWHQRSDATILDMLIGEIERRSQERLPIPAGSGYRTFMNVAGTEDKERRKDGQLTGGWGDAHDGAYCRISKLPSHSYFDDKLNKRCACGQCEKRRWL